MSGMQGSSEWKERRKERRKAGGRGEKGIGKERRKEGEEEDGRKDKKERKATNSV